MQIRAKQLVSLNRWATFAWILLIVPTLAWWRNAILWVAVMSIWANIVGHFSAYIAARAELTQESGYNLTAKDKEWLTYHIWLATHQPEHWSDKPTPL